MKKILYTAAKSFDGNLITAASAIKGQKYFCPVCNNEIILKKSGNTTKNSKRPHFAHKFLTENCTPETALHFTFKNLLAQSIQSHMQKNMPFNFSWECTYCESSHSGNLIKKAKQVEVEYNLQVAKPDIALLDQEGKVFAVIEIVVTHKPEEIVKDFYSKNNIIMIQINLSDDQDIYNIERKVSNPNIVTVCLNPKCSKCGSFMHKNILTITEGNCWKCDAPMKVAFSVKAGSTNGPNLFSDEELNLARSKGTIIKSNYSKTINENYLSNTCGKCGAFVGDHYLFTEYVAPASYGDIPSSEYQLGYYCPSCEEQQMYLE